MTSSFDLKLGEGRSGSTGGGETKEMDGEMGRLMVRQIKQ